MSFSSYDSQIILCHHRFTNEAMLDLALDTGSVSTLQEHLG